MSDRLSGLLARQAILILDGGLATELERCGADLNDALWSARLLLDRPELVRQVHLDYLRAGADCIVSGSYQGSLEGFARRGLDAEGAEAVLRLSVTLAREARQVFWSSRRRPDGRLEPLVAASIGPYGAVLADGSEYRGDYGLTIDELESFHRGRFQVLAGSGADLLAIETIPSHREALALARLLEASDGIEAWMSFSCRDESSLCDGTPLARVIADVESCSRLVAVGVNCTAPAFVGDLLRQAARATSKPLLAYPNTGEGYDAATRSWLPALDDLDLARACIDWRRAGATLIGGCCRTRPEDIAAMRRVLLGREEEAQ